MRIVPAGWSLAAALTIALVVRVAVLLGGWGSLALDDDDYGRLAVNWAETGTYGFPDAAGQPASPAAGSVAMRSAAMRPTAYRPPLYPWLLSWLVEHGKLNLVGVAGLHLGLGLASVWFTWAIAARLQIRWPALPSLAVACDPILLRGSQLVMTETLITFMALAIWAFWLCIVLPRERESSTSTSMPGLGGFALLGFVLGLSVLARPTMLPWAVCLVALSVLLPHFYRSTNATRKLAVLPRGGVMRQCCRLLALRVGIGRRELADKDVTSSGASSPVCASGFICAATVGLMLALTLLPWVVRNARMLGKPIWATTHGGYTLLLANNPSLYAHFRAHGPSRDWDASDFHRRWAMRRNGDPTAAEFWQRPLAAEPAEPPIDELSDDRLAQQSAQATIARDPAMFAQSCLYRIGWFWALAPHEASRPARLAIGAWYAVWFACALWGMVCIGRAWASPIWLAPAALVLTLTLVHAVYWSNMRMRAPLMPIVYVVAAVPLGGFLRMEGTKSPRHEESP